MESDPLDPIAMAAAASFDNFRVGGITSGQLSSSSSPVDSPYKQFMQQEQPPVTPPAHKITKKPRKARSPKKSTDMASKKPRRRKRTSSETCPTVADVPGMFVTTSASLSPDQRQFQSKENINFEYQPLYDNHQAVNNLEAARPTVQPKTPAKKRRRQGTGEARGGVSKQTPTW